MRKQPTEAQKQAAKERRDKFRAIVKSLGQMSEPERLQLASRLSVIATCEGHALSLNNQCLLAVQCPGATLVGGFRQWKKQGRAVKKGAGRRQILFAAFLADLSELSPQRRQATVFLNLITLTDRF